MKRMKRIVTILLAVCLIVPCFSMVTNAANGTIMFTDPTAATGESVTVTGVVKAGGPKIGDANVAMTYDKTALEFTSGDNVTAGTDGTLVYDVKGTGNETEHRFNMIFKVLKEGATKIDVASYKAYLFSDETLNCDKGSATVTATKGTEPVAPAEGETTDIATATGSDKAIKVGDKEYTLSQDFAGKDIPAGFVGAEMTYDGAQYKVVKQESSGIYLGYLVGADNVGKFFLYSEDDASFYPFEQVTISDTTSIILLSETKKVKLPEEFEKVSFAIKDSGNEFPAWQDTKTDGFYVVYAVNNEGTKGFYQYDKKEATYQRFEAPTVSETKKATSLLGKVENLLKDHLNYFILGAGLGILLLFVILIILASKLHNRNAELDDLYDEYGIDEEDDEPEEPIVRSKEKPGKEKKSLFASRADARDETFFDEEDEPDFDDEDDGYDEDFEDDDLSDDTRSLYEDEEDEDFKVDFIDLDD